VSFSLRRVSRRESGLSTLIIICSDETSRGHSIQDAALPREATVAIAYEFPSSVVCICGIIGYSLYCMWWWKDDLNLTDGILVDLLA
jgi:hypothetical protein